VIVGGSPMTRTLAELARALDWSTDLLSTQEFTAGCADDRSMVIVATQGHGDEDMIERAVAMGPAYLGLVASRRRGEAVLGYLAERGVPKDQLDRVHAPAGLDLGKTTHEEMAVAILAELVQLRARRAQQRSATRRGGRPGRPGRPGLRDDGHGGRVRPGARARRSHLLLLLRRLPPDIHRRSKCLHQGGAEVTAVLK
jgi:xanthine/CO dehydrogenase XdhC/CoxF family maturation factor